MGKHELSKHSLRSSRSLEGNVLPSVALDGAGLVLAARHLVMVHQLPDRGLCVFFKGSLGGLLVWYMPSPLGHRFRSFFWRLQRNMHPNYLLVNMTHRGIETSLAGTGSKLVVSCNMELDLQLNP